MGFATLGSNVFDREDLAAHIYEVNNRNGFVAGLVAPPLAVDKSTGTLLVVKATTGKTLETTTRGRRGAYPEVSGTLDSVSYSTADKGAEFAVDAVQAKQYASQLEMDKAASGAAFSTVAIRDEYDLFAGASSIYTQVSGNAASAAWTTYASAIPAADVAVEAAEITKLHGTPKSEMSLLIPRARFDILPFVADVRARLQIQTQPFAGSLTEAQLAQYFGVREVIVAGAVYNTAAEGQTASMGYIHPATSCLLFVKGEGNPAMSAGLARTPVWDDTMPYEEVSERIEAGGVPVIIDQRWDAQTRTMYYRARRYTGTFVQMATMGRKVTSV
jgi:hypothetical protein